eukprot:GFUD01014493.1.p1 GENE.GFUD01014493.1~~GFUD01014493.1.p1  ORF type:complete len:550 (-),score=160.96 GFUD01014493.1:128-1777(-)
MNRRDNRQVNSYSGSNYDVWSYQEAARTGTLNDSPLNKIQHKFWVAKQSVSRKLGHEEDEHVVASDSELDAKLELFRSIHETTCRLQRIMEVYQDRICFLAGEENALGRFLKEHGKADKTRAGKMMIAAGKTMSYTGQQRLAIRVPLVRLYQEVETFRQRAIEDTRWTVESMEKCRTEYRGALMWMKNVSTELDPDTFKQLEKFRKVQGHVKMSKQKFDKLKVDCLQKVDLLAASRCNMFSHALIMYQNTLVTFWDKTSKTMNHVNNGFKGYQYYEFNYTKELAAPSKDLANQNQNEDKTKKNDGPSFPGQTEKEKKDNLFFFESEYKDEDKSKHQEKQIKLQENAKNGSMHNLLDLDSGPDMNLLNLDTTAPLLDDDDEILLKIDSELETGDNTASLIAIDDVFKSCRKEGNNEREMIPVTNHKESEMLLDQLLADTADTSGGFTAEWEKAFQSQNDSDFISQTTTERKHRISNQSFLPSQLFDFGNLSSGPSGASGNMPTGVSGLTGGSGAGKNKDMSQWFSLFADLDPLANPDDVGSQQTQWEGGC